MGTSTSPAQLAGKLAGLGERLPATSAAAVAEAARITDETITAAMLGATGNGRLSGVGRNGNLRVVRSVGATGAVLTAVGPWHLIENDQPRHDVRARRKKALHWGNVTVAAAKNTGGSRGKHPWELGAAAAQPLAREAFRQITEAAIDQAFS